MDNVAPGFKCCAGPCGLDLPIEMFGRRSGLCHPCRKLYLAGWRAKHREHLRQVAAEFHAAHRVERTEYLRRWRVEHPEQRREIVRRSKAKRKDETNADTRNRRSRLAGNGGRVSAAEWRAIKARYDQRCLMCGEREPLSFDHVVPVDKGGPTTVANGQPLCRPCNSRKHRNTLDLRAGSPYDTRPDLALGTVI